MKNKYQNLDLRKYEGKVVSIELQHIIKEKQYGSFNLDEIHYSGWLDKIYGKKKSKIKKTIKEMFFIQHNNGGRRYSGKAKSYKEYFNNEVKEKIMAKRAAGLLGSLTMGDIEFADILVYFTDGTELDTMQFIDCPEEWYTEQHKGQGKLMIERGFYSTAKKAILAQKSSKDVFGKRFFPVVAFPISAKEKDIDKCTWQPKAVSLPIKTKDYIIYGSRCRPHELDRFIVSCYKIGGKVIIGTVWDWE